MKGFEPPTTPPQTEGSTKLSYIWLIMLLKEATGVAGIAATTWRSTAELHSKKSSIKRNSPEGI